MTETLTCDVLVAGSGAGGLAAAVTARLLGLEVVVAEKAPVFGGTTARSGGWLWIPCNPLAREAGIEDSPEDAYRYLQHEAGNAFDAERVSTFLQAGPEMVAFFRRHTALEFILGPHFSDYHPEAPGARPGGRSICAAPFDARALGPHLARLRPPLAEITLFGMMIGSGPELQHFFQATRSPRSALFVARLLARHVRDRLLYGRGLRLTNGNALAARLAKSAFDRGVPVWTSSPVRELILEGGTVRGALVEQPEGLVRIHTRRGVILACGGFPHDRARRARLFPHAPDGLEHFSPAPEENTGDGLALALAAGAALVEDLPNAAAWVPVSRVPCGEGRFGVFPHFIDRAKPGIIAVSPEGMRFTNEADSYHDFVQALQRQTPPGRPCRAFLIADHRAIRRYGMGFVKPAPFPLGPHLRSGYLIRAATPAGLAARLGLPVEHFTATLERFNAHAAKGEDPDFGRGRTAYNRYLGDPAHTPNPCLAPLTNPPYYALELRVGGSRHLRRPQGRCARPRLRRLRRPDPRPLRRRQRSCEHHGRKLSGRRHHARSRHDLRLHRRPSSCRPPLTPLVKPAPSPHVFPDGAGPPRSPLSSPASQGEPELGRNGHDHPKPCRLELGAAPCGAREPRRRSARNLVGRSGTDAAAHRPPHRDEGNKGGARQRDRGLHGPP